MSCIVIQKTSFIRESINKASCCNENTSFYKVAAVKTPPGNQFSIKIAFNNLTPFNLYLVSSEALEIEDLILQQDRSESPPLAGKQLVVFLQRLRIPYLFSIS